MPTDESKKHQLEDILSDNVSIMDTEDLSYEGTPVPVDEEAQTGFCVECKDQEVKWTNTLKCSNGIMLIKLFFIIIGRRILC